MVCAGASAGPVSGWNALEELPGNRLLITDEGRGRVIELNAERKLVGEWNVHSPRHAIRLPNGNLLVACGVSRKIVELDPRGTLISEHRAAGQTHRVRRR